MKHSLKLLLLFLFLFTLVLWTVVAPAQPFVNSLPSVVNTNGTSFQLDQRPVLDYSIKGATITNNATNTLFSTNGQGTITSIRFVWTISGNQSTNDQILIIVLDGQTNILSLLEYLGASGAPLVPWNTDTIDYICTGSAFAYQAAFGGARTANPGYNFKTNCAIYTIITNWNNGIFYSDILYKAGSPVVSNSWHAIEVVTNGINGTVWQILTNTGKLSQLESISMFATWNVPGNSQQYLESQPVINCDNGATYITANGCEDFFGVSFYGNAGASVMHTPIWGWEAEQNLTLLPLLGMTDGNMSYRFFNNALSTPVFWTNSFNFSFTNQIANSLNANFLVTFYTFP